MITQPEQSDDREQAARDFARQQKEKHLNEIRKRVDETTDDAGEPVEEGIKEANVAIRANEIPTSNSCEGHPEVGIAPWVQVEAPDRPPRDQLGDNEQTRTWHKANQEFKKKTADLLSEFYSNRKGTPPGARLIQERIGRFDAFRITNQGAPQLRKSATKKLSPKIKEKTIRFQKEMDAFAEFLMQKYLET